MTTDTKELLTYAAKVAGFHDAEWDEKMQCVKTIHLPGFRCFWNPATDDGDSARLRTTMGINVKWYADEVMVFVPTPLTFEERFSDHSGDKDAALRAATLRLAAEIGRRMP